MQKRCFLYLIVFFISVIANADAQTSGVSGTCTWTLDNAGTLIIKPTSGSVGTLGNWDSNTSAPWYEYRSQVKTVLFEGTVKAQTCIGLFYECSNLKNINLQGLDTSASTSFYAMFHRCSSLPNIDVSTLDTSKATNISTMFGECSALSSIDVSNFNTSNVTRMDNVFCRCTSMSSIDLQSFNTSKVTDMHALFEGCSNLKSVNVSSLDTSHVTESWYMFKGCSSLTVLDIRNFNTSNVVDMEAMFENCSSLEEIDLSYFSTKSAKYLTGLFQDCSSLKSIDLRAFSTATVLNMGYMFKGCSSLRSIDLSPLSTASVSNMSSMFEGCSSLVGLDLSTFDTGALSSMNRMFSGCSHLSILNLSYFNAVKVKSSYDTFTSCNQLLDVYSNSETPSTLFNNFFSTLPTLPTAVLHVPAHSASAYSSAAGWSSFNNIKEEAHIVHSGNCGENATWTLDADGLLVISGVGEVTLSPWNAWSINNSINAVEIKYGVTNIVESAFRDCKNITSVSIPNSIASVGAFSFYGCSKLTEILLPNSVTTIGDWAFHGTKIAEFTIPEFVISIGENIFTECSELLRINVESGNQNYSSIDGVLFSKDKTILIQYPNGKTGDYVIPDNVTSISANAFSNCQKLTSVTIPSTVTSIGQYAFQYCSELFDVINKATIPQVIENNTFSMYESLHVPASSLDIYQQTEYWNQFNVQPISVDYGSCGENAMWILEEDGLLTIKGTGDLTSHNWKQYSDKIQQVVVEEGITSITDYAFSDCRSLLSIELPSTLLSIGLRAFSGCNQLQFVKIPENVKRIGAYAFCNCVLDNITIPQGVTSIEEGTFSGNYFASVILPNTLVSIGDFAFRYCRGLYSFVIPENVQHIGKQAFTGCINLERFYVNENNSSYSSLDGVLYNKTITELVQYPIGKREKNYLIPLNVEAIEDYAFAECQTITSISIPNTIKSIGASAFSGCTKLKEVTNLAVIPQTIDGRTFSNYEILNVLSTSATMYQTDDNWKKFTIRPLPMGICGDNVSWALDNEGLLTISGNGGVSGNPWGTYSNKIKEVVVNNGVTSIGQGFFFGCSNLITVNVPGSVTNVGDNLFTECHSLAAVVWNPNIALPASAINGVDNPNFLLYVKSKSYAPSSVKNVVVNGEAESITLVDKEGNNNFYVPQAFTAKHISYTHNYSQETVIGKCAGWETIALPFDVQSIVHSRNGIIAPFGANKAEAKPFWLYSLGERGFVASASIKANTPYITSMPNNQEYADEYILDGNVEFSSEDVVVPETRNNLVIDGDFRFVPTTLHIGKDVTVYAINKNMEYDGQNPGSVFVSDLRDVSPFEAYLVLSETMAKASINLMDLGFDDDAAGIAIPIKNAGMRIWCSNGILHISTDKAKTIRIYSVSGALIRTVNLTEGVNTLSLPAGAYVVESTKVFVH